MMLAGLRQIKVETKMLTEDVTRVMKIVEHFHALSEGEFIQGQRNQPRPATWTAMIGG
jgi:hypothetical protein